VLIVEDEIAVLMFAESVLEQAGHAILTAYSVAEAQIIIRSGQTVHLVFTDLELGHDAEGGTTVGELVNRQCPGIPVLYTSGHARTCTPFLPQALHRPGVDKSRSGPATSGRSVIELLKQTSANR
jgi:DNA-binding NtrC family response regulator